MGLTTILPRRISAEHRAGFDRATMILNGFQCVFFVQPDQIIAVVARTPRSAISHTRSSDEQRRISYPLNWFRAAWPMSIDNSWLFRRKGDVVDHHASQRCKASRAIAWKDARSPETKENRSGSKPHNHSNNAWERFLSGTTVNVSRMCGSARAEFSSNRFVMCAGCQQILAQFISCTYSNG
jgi:hypothetical protein